MKSLRFAVRCVWSLCFAAAAVLRAATWNVRDFGASGDGATKDTAAFQRALDACAVDGGGEVLVPRGEYLIGNVQLGRATTLRFEEGGVLRGSGELADYPLIDVRWEGRWQPGHRALIHAADVDDVGVVGPGLIIGNPETAASNRQPRGTLVVEFIRCKRVRWEGFSVRQEGNNWATHPTLCEDVTIRKLDIRGSRDGIDVDSCRRVLIEGCFIDTGDDSISLKSGRGLDGARLGLATEDVTIRDCELICRRFACIGIGSEISAGVRGVTIERCKLRAATHAIYLKSRVGRGGASEGIHARDLDVSGGGFLRINLLDAGNTNTADDPVPGLAGYPRARDLSFTDVRLHDVGVVAEATRISVTAPLEGLVLRNVSGTARAGIRLAQMRGVVIEALAVEGVSGPVLAAEEVEGVFPSKPAELPGRVTLWNGVDLTGWKLVLSDPAADHAAAWDAKDGLLRLHSPVSGYLRTEASYANYRLHAEWRWAAGANPKSNSGVLVHVRGEDKVWPVCIQAQLKIGQAGQLIGMETPLPGVPEEKGQWKLGRAEPASERAVGEWNAIDVYASKDTLEVFVNGVRQNRVDQLAVREGPIGLQLEGQPVEFRALWLRPL